MAFAGNRDELVNKLDVSHGLLNKLLDRNIITRRHNQLIKVFFLSSFFSASPVSYVVVSTKSESK